MSVKVSVVIATKNRVECLKRCIECLIAQTRLPDELIVVDASVDGKSKEYVNSLNCGFDVVYIRQDMGGLPSARNLGVERCTSDIIVFLDDDVALDRKYLEEILSSYSDDPNGRLGGVTGVLQGDDTSEDSCFRRQLSRFVRTLFLMDSLGNDGKVLPTGMLPRMPNTWAYVQAFRGHNMSFRKHVLDEFKFDEMLEIYPWALGEDVDFSYMVGKKYLLLVNPRAKLTHGLLGSEDYKFSQHFYFQSSTMIVHNFYYITCKNLPSLTSKFGFAWAIIGLLIGRFVALLLHPSTRRWFALKGVVNGIKLVLLHGQN